MNPIFVPTDDSSRVPLTEIEGTEGSTYINASYIDVSATALATICTHMYMYTRAYEHYIYMYIAHVVSPLNCCRATGAGMLTLLHRVPCQTLSQTSGG